jgi:HSP20 family protein
MTQNLFKEFPMYTRLLAPVTFPSQVHAHMNRLFRGAFDADETPVARTPGLNIWEQDNNVVIEAELPGLTLGEVEVTSLNRDVTITGTRKTPEIKDASWVVRERGTGAFTRSVRLPYDVDSTKAQATLKDGVLTLTLPRIQPVGPHKVNIIAV